MNFDSSRQPRTAGQPVRHFATFLAACGLLAAGAQHATAQTNPLVVSTVAGLANFGSADGIESLAKFLYPASVAVDTNGNVYVADAQNCTIRKIATNGIVTTIAGQAGLPGATGGNATNSATFTYPYGVAVDNSNNIYVADTGNNLIRKISGGSVTTIGGSASPAFSSPYGVAVDNGGNVYVADTGRNLIRKITPGGTVTSIGTSASPAFSAPYALAVDGATNVYVADYNNSLVRVIAPSGTVTTVDAAASPPFSSPLGIALDSSSNIYVSDFNDEIIRVIPPGGNVNDIYTLAGISGAYGDGDGSYGSPDATLNGPWGVAVDKFGNVYVGDSGNGNVREIVHPSDALITLAGADESHGVNGPVDATGNVARFNLPNAVAIDAASNIYVADYYNNCIRLVTPAGKVTTLAGSVSGFSGSSDGTNNDAEFYYPSGIAVDPATNLYVADYYNSTIRMITPDATHSNWVTTTIAGQALDYSYGDGVGTNAIFNGPYGITIDPATNLYVTDVGNAFVRVLTNSAGNWKVSTYSMGPFVAPTAITLDSLTNLYVSDTNLIYQIPPSGTATLFVTNLSVSQGLAVVGTNLYVAGANHTITGIGLQTQAGTIVAGYPGVAGSADGYGTATRLDNPNGLAVDASSNLYIADSGNNTIRKAVISTAQTAVLTVNTSPAGLPIGVNGTNFLYTPQVFAFKAGSTNVVTNTGVTGYTFTNWSSNSVVVTTNKGFSSVLVSNTTIIGNFNQLPAQVAVLNGGTTITNGQTNAVNFGSVQEGSTGPSITFTVTNTGGLALSLGAPNVPSGYTVTVGLPATLAVGASTTFTVQLNSSSAGTFTGQISFTNNTAASNPYSFAVTGTVNATPATVAVFNGAAAITNGQTSPVSFGNAEQNFTGPSVTFTVTNSGESALNVGTPSLPSGYSLTGGLASSIAGGSSATFTVQLNTGVVGTFSGAVSFTNNVSGQNPFTFNITGTVLTPPEISVLNGATPITNGQAGALNFGSVQQNLTGPTITFTVTNSGGMTLNLGTPSLPSGYTLAMSPPTTIAPGSNGTFTVQLNTGSIGTFSGQVSLTNNDPNNNPFTFPVTGAVLTPPTIAVFNGGTPITNVQAGAVSFGSVQQNLTPPSIAFTVTNSGALPLNLGTPSVPSGYTLTTNLPSTIAAGSSGVFVVQLNTGTVGVFTGQISFTNNDPNNNPFAFPVTGTVQTPPQIAIFNGATALTNGQTNVVNFGSVQQNLTGPSITFTVTNSGALPLGLGTPSVPSGYTLTTNISAIIAAGGSGTFTVQLNTGTVGVFAGTISLANNSPGNTPYVFPISGTVLTPPEVAVFNGAAAITNGQTNVVSFGSVQQNLAGPSITFTVTNSGALPLNLGTPSVPSGFALTTNLPSTIAAGGSGTFTVQLNTGTVGAFSGQVSFSANDPNNTTFSFPIAGTVLTPPRLAVFNGAIAITNGQTNAVSFGTVVENAAAPAITFTVTNSGALTLNVGTPSLPSGYTLATNLPSTIAAGSSATFTVQMNTGAGGVFAGQVSFANNDPNNNPFTFAITGTVNAFAEAGVFNGATVITNGQSSPVDFGTAEQNLTPPAITFTVTNSGGVALNVGTPSVPSGYTVITNPLSTIAPGSNGLFTVQLNTGALGTFSGQISFTNNDVSNNPFAFPVTGTVITPPQIAVFNGENLITNLQTEAVSFGSVQQNFTGTSITFTLTNGSGLALTLSNLTVPSGFIIVTNLPSSIGAGGSGTFTVQLNTGTVGTFSGLISFSNNSPGNNPFWFDISGTVLAPPQVEVFNGAVQISNSLPSGVNFGSIQQNLPGPSVTFTVTNSGGEPLALGTPSVPSGYTLTTNLPSTIAPGTNGTFTVQLNTGTVGTFAGQISFTNNDPTNNPFGFAVMGTVLTPPEVAVFNGAVAITNNQTNLVNFGNVQQNLAGPAITFTVTNSGALPLNVGTPSVPSSFTLTTNLPASIVAGSSAPFTVQLNTGTVGTFPGSISFTNNAPGNTNFTFPITGTVLTPPEMEVFNGATAITDGQTNAVTFASVVQNSAGSSVMFTVTNAGALPLNLGTPSLPSGYSLIVNVPSSIAAGSKGTFLVQLNTTNSGTFSGSISISNNAPGSNPFTFAISGTVLVPAQVAVFDGATAITNGQTNVINFGSVQQNLTAPSVTFTVTNSGQVALTVANLAVPSGFAIVTNLPSSIAAGSNSTFTVQLNTGTVGPFSGNITFTNSSTNNSSFAFPVAGIVLTPPEVAVFNGSTAITNGQTNAISFGSPVQNTAAPSISFTVTNAGALTLNAGALSVPTGFAIATNLPSTIAAGASAKFTIQLNTAASGPFSGVVSFTNNAPVGSNFSFAVAGTVIAPAAVAVFNGATAITNGQPNAVSFGTVEQGLPGTSITFTVTNSGGVALNAGTVSVPSGYTLTTNLASTIAPGSNATFTVQQNTGAIGTFPGNIMFTNSAPTNSTFSFPITGTIITPPQVAVFNGSTLITNGQTNAVSFGSVQQNLTGPSITFTVTNSSGLTLNVGTPSLPSGFTLTTNLPSSIGAGSSGAFSVRLNTGTVGTFSGPVSFTNNSPGNTNFTFPITGTVLTPPQIAIFDGATAITNGQTNAINLGSVQQNLAGPTVTFTVTNSGALALAVGTPSLTSAFTLITNLPTSIAAGSNAVFTVQLSSGAVGTFNGTVSISNNAPAGNPFTFAIQGTVIAPPQVAVLKGATAITNGQTNVVSFGSVQQNLTGPSIIFTVTNSGGFPLNTGTPSLPSGYTLTTNLPSTIAAGSSGAFTVQLNSGTVGTFPGSISFTNNAPGNTNFTFPITGTILTPPQIAVFNGAIAITNGQTNAISFGSVQQHLTGTSITFTITNSGAITLNVGTPTVPPGFSVTTNPPSAIAAGGSGKFTVQLNTSTMGAFSGNVSFTNNAPGGNPFVFAVAGTVLAPPSSVIGVLNGTNVINNNQTNAVNLGTVQQFQTAASLPFTITNSGGQPLVISNIVVPAGYTLNTNYPTNIAAGGSGAFSVQLTTNVLDTYAGNIVISNNSPVNPFSFPVTSLVTGQIISLVGNLTFGVVPIGSSSATNFTISNNGNTNLTVTSITFSNAAFSASWNSGQIAANASTNVTVTFSPTIPTNYSGGLTVNSDATSGTNTLAISAFGANTNLLLTLITNGLGTITPNDAKFLKLNQKITLKANPGVNQVFSNWVGSTNSTNNPLSFTMKSNTIVQANFIPNPFIPFEGTYNGLFWATNGIVAEQTAGMLKGLSVTSKGAYSGSLALDGASKSLSGSFGLNLQASKTVSFGNSGGNVTVALTLTSNQPAPQVTGTVSGSGWVATNLVADRATNNNQISAEYTMLIPPDTNVAGPAGSGYAEISATAGNAKTPATAKITGFLPDGTSFSQSVSVSQDGYIPVYANIYSGKGLLIGWLYLETTNDPGSLAWVHPSGRPGLFPTGFTATNATQLSPWVNPPNASTIPTNLVVIEMSSTGALQTNNYTFVVNNNKVSGTSTNGTLTGTLNTKTGQLSVTFDKITANGVLLPNGTNGGGYFLTKTNSGAILLPP